MARAVDVENREHESGPEKQALLVYLKAAVVKQDERYIMDLCGYWPEETPSVRGAKDFDGRVPPMEEQEFHFLTRLPGAGVWFKKHLDGKRGKKPPQFWKVVGVENAIKKAERA